VIQYVKNCDSCQNNKSHNLKPAGLLKPLEIRVENWNSFSLDFTTRLPKTRNGKDAILVFVDRLNNDGHFVATTTRVSVEETAKLFIETILRLHNLPRDIVPD
jgi:hypothetical protein